MRFILLPFVAAMTVSNAPFVAESKPRPTGLTADEAKSHTQDHCDDRIEWVREELDQPKLQQETASPDKPLLIAAVDKRIDGCAVLQMHNDINDLRPLPSRPSGPPRLQPAN